MKMTMFNLQIKGREALKPLYTCYFWFWTLGDTGAIMFCGLVDTNKKMFWYENEIIQAPADLNTVFNSMLVGMSGLTLAASTLSTFVICVGKLLLKLFSRLPEAQEY